MAALVVWTVGHSTQPAGGLVSLLAGHQIEVLADVRSQPYSRNPQFSREPDEVNPDQATLFG